MMTPTQGADSRLLEVRLKVSLALRSAQQLGGPIFEEITTLRQSVIDQAWDELSERASRCHGLGYSAFRRLQGGARKAGTLDALDGTLFAIFSNLFQIVAKSKQSVEFVGALRDKLESSDPQERLEALLSARQQAGRPPLTPEVIDKARAAVTTKASERVDIEDSIEKLSKGKTKGVSLLESVMPRAGRIIATEIDRSASFALLGLCRGLLASAHAEFNLALASVSPRANRARFAYLHDAFGGAVEEYERCLQLGQRRLYGALIEGRPMPEVADVAVSMAGEIEQTLPLFVRTQAVIRLAMLRLREAGKGTAAEQLGRLALQAGSLTREAIASHCASYRLALGVLDPQAADDVASLLKDTNSLAFAVELPNGKNVSLKQLDAELEDKFVEIEGFVTAVDAERESDGKLISHLALLDPSSGSRADAVAVFAHLPHAGVTQDSFCRLSGVFKSRSRLFERKPAVEVDILSLGELSKVSWRIAFLRLASRWFEPWRNGANLYWSLGPHGIVDDIGFLGAGELLFTPFVRN